MAKSAAQQAVAGWFAARGWTPFAFQRQVWRALAARQSGLLHATTGAGKTYAVWLGALQAFGGAAAQPISKNKPKQAPALAGQALAAIKKGVKKNKPLPAAPLTVLWLTPMRALAADTLRALQTPLQALAPHHAGWARWSVGARTGDSTSAERSAQQRRLPTALVTTPESLALMLARADARAQLSSVQLVVVDEWHELVGNKRGVQVQLALARLCAWQPALCIWGMSATLGNLDEAQRTLLGWLPDGSERPGVQVQGQVDKRLAIDTLLPEVPERFGWAGHLGLRMLAPVVRELEGASGTTLVFVNTRAQAELWYQALLEARPGWAGLMAIHHGALDRGVREWVEAGLKAGSLRVVVCTSSLDLGVDFLPVGRVLQIGSPKGVARLLQRAGRSGHAPGRPSRITLVPTHSLELLEAAAARAAVQAGRVEARRSPQAPVDVLVQHLATVALGGGFVPAALYAQVRRTAAYRQLDAATWQWCLDFVRHGGASLAVYPDFQRVLPDEEGIWRMPDARLARRHRANIGTIVGDASMAVQMLHGARLGRLEESFLTRLQPGECFLLAGRALELVKIEQMTAYVRRAPPGRATVPRWSGARMALSPVLAGAVLEQLALAAQGQYTTPELRALRPLLALQQRWSQLPTPGRLLAETLRTREGWHLFVYPFAGRQVHMGLASLWAWRAAQGAPGTFSIAANDYGLELLSATERDWAALLPGLLAGPLAVQEEGGGSDGDGDLEGDGDGCGDGCGDGSGDALLRELRASVNATEMAKRRFREIARVSGLIFQSRPGEQRSARQLQASAQLYFEVFRQYDPDNLLLRQADLEVLQQELDLPQLRAALRRLQAQTLALQALERPSPLAFPLLVERLRDKLSNESLAERIARMLAQAERAADEGAARTGARPGVRKKRAGTTAPAAPSAAMRAPETATDGAAAEQQEQQEQLGSVRAALAFSPGNAARDADAKARTARRPRKVSRPLPPL